MIFPELIKAIIGAVKSCGAGLATIGLTGAGVGVGLVFASLVFISGRVPSEAKNVFKIAMLIICLLCIKVNGEDDDNYEQYSLSQVAIKIVFDRVIKDINEKKEINNKQKIDSSILTDEEINKIYQYLFEALKPSILSLEKEYQGKLVNCSLHVKIYIDSKLYYQIYNKIEKKLENIEKDKLENMEKTLNEEMYDEDNYEEILDIIKTIIKNIMKFFVKISRFIRKRFFSTNYEQYRLSDWQIKIVFDRVIKDINEKKEINNKQKIDSSILTDEEINKIYLYVFEALKPSILSLEKQYQRKFLTYRQIINKYIESQLYNQIYYEIEEKLDIEKDFQNMEKTLNEEMYDDDNYEDKLDIVNDNNYKKYNISKDEIKEVIDRVINDINKSYDINNKKKIDSSILEDEEINKIYINLLINIEPDVISLENNYKEEFKYGLFIEIINNHIKTLLYFEILERIEEKLKKLKK